MIPDGNYTIRAPAAESPIRQSIKAAQASQQDRTTHQDVPCVPTLLDKAQRTRQLLLSALRDLNTVLNDKECVDVDSERGIDQPQASLTHEMELTHMLVGGLLDRIGDLQRRVGQL
jgi:hypothetical protein